MTSADIWHLLRLGPEVEGRAVLDLGCYEGAFCDLALRAAARAVTGVDSDENSLRIARSRIRGATFVASDAIDFLEQASLRYDVVLCLSILHHLREPARALRGLRRVVADGGLTVIETEVWDTKLHGGRERRLDSLHEPITEPVPGSRWGLGWYPTDKALKLAAKAAGFAMVNLRAEATRGVARRAYTLR